MKGIAFAFGLSLLVGAIFVTVHDGPLVCVYRNGCHIELTLHPDHGE